MAEQKARPVQKADAKDIEDNKVFAILAYLGILVLVPLLAAKESRFARYHTNQGLVLFLTSIICGFLIWIPIVGWLLGLGLLALWVIGIINAAQGEMKPLPLIGGITLIK